MNRQGPKPLGEVKAKPLSLEKAIEYFQRGAAMLDTRPKADYVEKHVPGAVHIAADSNQISNRIGFVLPPNLPIVLVVEDEQAYQQVVYSLARVGYDQSVMGYLVEGLQAWEERGLPVTSGDIQDITPEDLGDLLANGNGNRPVVLDVREPWEFRQGHVPGAVLIPLGELGQRVSELDPDKPVAVICATGSRSQSAAALLGQKNFKTIYNVLNGTMGWANQGKPLER